MCVKSSTQHIDSEEVRARMSREDLIGTGLKTIGLLKAERFRGRNCSGTSLPMAHAHGPSGLGVQTGQIRA